MANIAQKVFVVDDDELIARSVSELLRLEGYSAEGFYDASSALLRASDCPPDILVTDVNMPGMDGIALAKMMRELSPNCKIIVITGNLKVKASLHADGLDSFKLLLKPFSPRQILLLVNSQAGGTIKASAAASSL